MFHHNWSRKLARCGPMTRVFKDEFEGHRWCGLHSRLRHNVDSKIPNMGRGRDECGNSRGVRGWIGSPEGGPVQKYGEVRGREEHVKGVYSNTPQNSVERRGLMPDIRNEKPGPIATWTISNEGNLGYNVAGWMRKCNMKEKG